MQLQGPEGMDDPREIQLEFQVKRKGSQWYVTVLCWMPHFPWSL